MTVQHEMTQEPRLGVDVIGFGVGELAYLLNVFEGPARDRSVSVFRAEDLVEDSTLNTAGASSLLARDLAVIADDQLGVKGVAAAVATALGHATRWTEMSLLTEDSMDNVVLLEAPEVSLMLQPRALGTWFAFAQDPTIGSAEAILRVVRQHVNEHPGGTAYLVFKTLEEEKHLLVRRDGDTWATGVPDFASDQVAETTCLDDSRLLMAIKESRGEA